MTALQSVAARTGGFSASHTRSTAKATPKAPRPRGDNHSMAALSTPSSPLRSDLKSVPRRRALTARSPIVGFTSGLRFARPLDSGLRFARPRLPALCRSRAPWEALRSGPWARLAQIMPFSCIIFAGIGCSTSQCSTRMPSSARKISITLSSCSTGRLRPIFTCRIT